MSKISTIDDVNRALDHLTRAHPELADAHTFVTEAKLQVPLRLRPGGFAGLSEIVISQLVSKASANAIHQRFIQHISPLTPAAFLDAGESVWKQIGLSRPKYNTLCAISTAMTDGTLRPDTLDTLPVETAEKQLTAIKGIGPWTAQVYLLFCAGHSDIFPAGDLALREAYRLIKGQDQRPSDAELSKAARQWSPWRGTAARLLWTYYAAKKQKQDAAP